MFLNSQEAPEVAEERVDAMLAFRRAEERRLAGSEVCAKDWTPAGRWVGKIPEILHRQSFAFHDDNIGLSSVHMDAQPYGDKLE